MEEKLYFKPAKYGKGIRKKTEKEKAGEKTHRARNLILFLLTIATIAIIILWLLHGKTVTTGQYPENLKNETLECISKNTIYSKVDSVDSKNKELMIRLLFYGDKTLSSLSLKYTMVFQSRTEAVSAEAISHAQFNTGLQKAGYSSEKLNNKFTIVDNELAISLYVTKNDIDEYLASYLLLENNYIPNTLNEFKQIYEKQGFSCNSSLDKN